MNVVYTIIASIVLGVIVFVTFFCMWLNYSEERDINLINSATNRELSKDVTFYERYVKRLLDIIFAFIGIVLSFPIVLVAVFFIYVEDPGSVIFSQKRVGINKTYFYIHKLRSMKQNTGDIPTHMLTQEEQQKLILKIGRIIRKTSCDEFPQLFDILRGRMSIVSPRPALWNQDDLITERDKYGANDVRPGLTGLAQISGRDELEISVKARLDGEYVEALRKSSWSGFKMDCRCFFGTFAAVIFTKGVVEGGTGTIGKIGRTYTDEKSDKELIGLIGFGECVEVDRTKRKHVLITGADSYIGEQFVKHVKGHYNDNFVIDELDMLNGRWGEKSFSQYDIVFHVAGMAHADVGKISDDIKNKYYEVNTDLAVAVAQKAKNEGVKEFIFMSSMIVYGNSGEYGKKRIIDSTTVPKPANFYGDSKLQADVAVRELASDDFKVLVLRPPMIYGPGCKGNYRTLAKLAQKVSVFPEIDNRRSMLFVGNLCEFLCQIMLVKKMKHNAVVLIPQNSEWTKTSSMVKAIANAKRKKMLITKILNPIVAIGCKMPGKISVLVDKAFGSNCYSHELSNYPGICYQGCDLLKSIEITEGKK